MSTLSPRPLIPTLLPSLNALLDALAIPFTLDHPTDLTPSLLLAIFESLINARLPIPTSVRQSRTRDAKARAMLVLLGVLECDVLRGGTAAVDADHSIAASNADDSVIKGAGGVSVDGWVDEIGLGEVDPEQLADGGWEETIFVGELLCWLARRKGILPRTRSSCRPSHQRSLYSNHHSYGTEEAEGDTTGFSTSLLLRPSPTPKARTPPPPSPSPSFHDLDADHDPDFSTLSHITDIPRHPLVHSPEPSLSASATTGTDLSIRARSISSRTSVSNTYEEPDEFEEALQDTLQMYDPVRMMQDAEDDGDQPPSFRPRCIHELEDPSHIRALDRPSTSFDRSVSGEGNHSTPLYGDADMQDRGDPYSPSTPTPRRVRLTGWIDSVDSATELSQFITSRSRPRAFNTDSDSGPLHSQFRKNARFGEPSQPMMPRSKTEVPHPHPGSTNTPTPWHTLPSPSPSPSPPPSRIPRTSSKHPPTRSPSSPPPSPPLPAADVDPSFDISFSTFNNTSTPAKPRPLRRPQRQPTALYDIETVPCGAIDGRKSEDSIETSAGTGRLRHRDRSPSYTPSPPSFSTSGSSRTGGASGTSASTRSGSAVSSGTRTYPGASPSSTTPIASTTSRTHRSGSQTPMTTPSANAKSTSTRSGPLPGSTTTTNTLLTERARLLTELAALKRARAASGGTGTTGGSGVGQRVGIGF